MAKSENSTGTVIQSWVSPKFAREVRALADLDGRSVSGLIKVALRERLRTFQTETSSPPIRNPAPGGPNEEPRVAKSRPAVVPDAGFEEKS